MTTKSATSRTILWNPPGASSVQFGLRHVWIPLSLLALAGAFFVLHLKGPLLLALALAFPLLQFGATVLTQRRWLDVERQITARVLRGDAEGAYALWRRSWWVRAAGPRARVLAKGAMLCGLRGDWLTARALGDDAWGAASPAERFDLLSNAARARLELREWDELLRLAMAWREAAPTSSSARVYLAAAFVWSSRPDREDAAELIAAIGPLTSPREVALLEETRLALEKR